MDPPKRRMVMAQAEVGRMCPMFHNIMVRVEKVRYSDRNGKVRPPPYFSQNRQSESKIFKNSSILSSNLSRRAIYL
jgi:hypothetical protein